MKAGSLIKPKNPYTGGNIDLSLKGVGNLVLGAGIIAGVTVGGVALFTAFKNAVAPKVATVAQTAGAAVGLNFH